MIKTKKTYQAKIKQGDLLKNIEFIESIDEKDGNLEIRKINFPLVIVLSQDCDLNQDHDFRYGKYKDNKTHDKYLISVLVAPLYNIDHFTEGNHLELIGRTAQMIPRFNKKRNPTTKYKNLLDNEIPRYHYLEFDEHVPIVPSVIDFKHYFTVNVEYLKKYKKQNFVCSVSNLYRERISQRFSYFLGRIGLP
ncbi:MAG: hypothetical protein HGJ94_18210 [Desulfosarcina sp.]|nr:hypothetical protein [Desulfosarcina sp.]